MANDVMINAASLEQAIDEAVARFAIPREALEYEELKLDTGDLLTNVVHDDEDPKNTVSIRVWINNDYLTRRGCELLQRLLDQMQIETEITSRFENNLIQLKVVSQVNELLIGRNGETLEALEYLVNKMLARGGVISPPVVVDIEGYRQKHLEYLDALARSKATQAAKTNSEVEMQPMESGERKIVHAILTGFAGVKTFSRGQEEERRIIIAPDGTPPDPSQFVNTPPRRPEGAPYGGSGPRRDSRDNRDTRNTRSPRDARDNRETRDPRGTPGTGFFRNRRDRRR